jgi:hypothetical protein
MKSSGATVKRFKRTVADLYRVERNFYYTHYAEELPPVQRVRYNLYEEFNEAISILIYSP